MVLSVVEVTEEFLARAPGIVEDMVKKAKGFVEPDDPAAKAAEMMLNNDLILLPVIEDKKKFVGVVRMIEISDELTSAI